MPRIIDYPIVLEQLQSRGFKCNYHNSGAFGFASGEIKALGWIGPDDPTIRPQIRPLTRPILRPYEATLARLCTQVWLNHLPGPVWLMPMSHWAYELAYGSHDWMPALIQQIHLDPADLENRNNGSAIEFSPDEAPLLETAVHNLLENLMGSDFMLVFENCPVLCTVHHHKQLWWQTTDANLMRLIEAAVRTSTGG